MYFSCYITDKYALIGYVLSQLGTQFYLFTLVASYLEGFSCYLVCGELVCFSYCEVDYIVYFIYRIVGYRCLFTGNLASYLHYIACYMFTYMFQLIRSELGFQLVCFSWLY